MGAQVSLPSAVETLTSAVPVPTPTSAPPRSTSSSISSAVSSTTSSAMATGAPSSGNPYAAGSDMPPGGMPPGMPSNFVNGMPMLIPLVDPSYREGMTAISVLSFVSLFACFGLTVYLAHHIIQRRRKHLPQNQLAVLIFNLMLADIQQTIGFLLSVHWLRRGVIDGFDNACWAQGWFLMVGNVASALFSMAIALYTFVFITYRYQLGPLAFYLSIVFVWVLIYIFPIISILAHDNTGWFIPQGPVCMMNNREVDYAMYLHYFWIILAEIVSLVLYTALFAILRIRVRKGIYQNARANKALVVSRLSFLFPAAYIICTVPMLSIPAVPGHPTIQHICAGSSLWVSIGFLDVILYVFTRSFDADVKKVAKTQRKELATQDSYASSVSSFDPLDTFDPWWFQKSSFYGTTTTIESLATLPKKKSIFFWRNKDDSSDDVPVGVQTHTTVNVTNAPLPRNDIDSTSQFDIRAADTHTDPRYKMPGLEDVSFKSGESFLNV